MEHSCVEEYLVTLEPRMQAVVEKCLEGLDDKGMSVNCEQLQFLLAECEDDPEILIQVINQDTAQLILSNYRPPKPVEEYS